jgi:DeoR family fructose operon transcriptional repressor
MKGGCKMIPYVRRSKILEMMHSKKIVYFEEISEQVGVSMATVRRDLKTLEEEGQLDLRL